MKKMQLTYFARQNRLGCSMRVEYSRIYIYYIE